MENFLAAALASSDPGVAARATQLAVGCEQLVSARAAAQRWLQLEPFSGDASLTAALVALKRYDLVDARKALTSWRDSGSAGSQDPLRFAELLAQETEATAVYRVFREVQTMAEARASDALARLLAGQELRRSEPKVPYNGAHGVPIREGGHEIARFPAASIPVRRRD